MAFDFDDGEGIEVDLGSEPAGPPPDPDKPYMWMGPQVGWMLIVTDTSDGVPEDLELPTAADKGLDPWEGDAHHALMIADPATRARALEELAKHLPGKHDQSSHGHGGSAATATNMMGGPMRSSIPGAKGGPPVPRQSLANAATTADVAAVTSSELEAAMGRPVPVDFTGVSPQMAREYGEGLIRVAEKYPENDLAVVDTYGPNGTKPTHPGDPMFEATAITSTFYAAQGRDEMAFNTAVPESMMRTQWASSATMGGHTAPSPTGTAVHEMGHVVSLHSSADITSTNVMVDHAVAAGASTTQDFTTHISRNISIYATDSPAEAMAEAFADVEINGSGASPLSQDVHAVIDTYYRANNPP